MERSDPHVSVCICTYKRAEFLTRLLKELGTQETKGLFTYSIVIADNDAEESGKPVVNLLSSNYPVPITYCVERRQNIALARNMAIENATGDYIAFIDDDEFPANDWLLRMVETCRKHDIDGALGPVKPYFEYDPPRWVVRGNFYERPTHDTGFIIDWNEGRTGNLLFNRSILEGTQQVFRPQFGSGGEDRDFFQRMIRSGRVFMWCNEAVVYEIVPPVRWKRGFMLRRALLRGKVSLSYASTSGLDLLRSLVAVPVYAIGLPVFLLLGQHIFMKYLIKLCDHLGRILSFLGLNVIKQNYVIE